MARGRAHDGEVEGAIGRLRAAMLVSCIDKCRAKVHNDLCVLLDSGIENFVGFLLAEETEGDSRGLRAALLRSTLLY